MWGRVHLAALLDGGEGHEVDGRVIDPPRDGLGVPVVQDVEQLSRVQDLATVAGGVTSECWLYLHGNRLAITSGAVVEGSGCGDRRGRFRFGVLALPA